MSALISVYYNISTLRADYLRGKNVPNFIVVWNKYITLKYTAKFGNSQKKNHTYVSDPLRNHLERDKERGKIKKYSAKIRCLRS